MHDDTSNNTEQGHVYAIKQNIVTTDHELYQRCVRKYTSLYKKISKKKSIVDVGMAQGMHWVTIQGMHATQ